MKSINDLIAIVQAWIDRQDADGCLGCAFEDKDEWQLPCCRCKRNCKDYWRTGGRTADMREGEEE